eukprot:SM008720S23783  [mRNA]  locus=s8720:7:383:+ [translate_table: standard]
MADVVRGRRLRRRLAEAAVTEVYLRDRELSVRSTAAARGRSWNPAQLGSRAGLHIPGVDAPYFVKCIRGDVFP